jgi:uncharacterized SAM-binding protein YcdF (DUF218 family)
MAWFPYLPDRPATIMWMLTQSLPGSIPFLMFAFLVGLGLLWRPRTRRWGRLWLSGLFLIYMGFSLPAVSRMVARPLGWGFAPLQTAAEAPGAQAVVVLDGGTRRFQWATRFVEFPNGSSVMRALEAARVYHLLGAPLVVVSGGDLMWDRRWAPEASAVRDLLVKLGVPARHLLLDSNSVNTRAHATNLVNLLRERGISRFVLVTSPTHIRRSLASFRAVGADPVPSPCALLLDSTRGLHAFWPSLKALELAEPPMHDYVGLVYYRLRGWA